MVWVSPWRCGPGRPGPDPCLVASEPNREQVLPAAHLPGSQARGLRYRAPMGEVLYEVRDHVATITLNAPERMNTISGPMLTELSARLLEADTDRDTRCI